MTRPAKVLLGTVAVIVDATCFISVTAKTQKRLLGLYVCYTTENENNIFIETHLTTAAFSILESRCNMK